MQQRFWITFVVVILLLTTAGCSTPADTTPTATAASTAPEAVGKYPKLFVQSTTCAGCHDALKDSSGADYSIAQDWASSMHAHAARDPYFIATVRAEVEQHPKMAEDIEKTCATCHFPMARTTDFAVQEPVQIFGEGYVDEANPLHPIGMDGVSCQLCHQVQQEGLGSAASFNGGYVVDLTKPFGERDLFGPFEVSDSTNQLKKAVLGSSAMKAGHLGSSEFCAVCHTLYTPVVDADGNLQEKPFPEQMVYLEWQNSEYNAKVSCQACHMPHMDGSAVVANLGGLPERKPVSQHTFIGANGYMIALTAANRNVLKVNTSEEVLQKAVYSSQEFLRTQTAEVSAKASRSGNDLKVTVSVLSKTGHKLPSAYPSRRAWLHLTVKNAGGEVLFESGQYGPDGKIMENDNDQDASRYEPHYDLITDASQVQIYEAIMGSTEGEVTTELLRANRYLKDNRLLPSGFDKAGAVEDIRVMGEAAEDHTFSAGGDVVSYQMNLNNSEGPLTITVELLYQSIGYRWAHNIGDVKTPEGEAFLSFVESNPPVPVTIAETKLEVK